MPTIMFPRVGWSLSISHSSRQVSVLLATGLPRQRHHHSQPTRQPHPTPRLLEQPTTQRLDAPVVPKPHFSRPHTSLRSFSTTNVFRQEAAAAAVAPNQSSSPASATTSDLTAGFNDEPLILDEGTPHVDWARSFHGLSAAPFPKEAADVLTAPVNSDDVEVKPDGVVYLPEIKYRRILNKAFGPGAWGLAPRGETIVTPKAVTREYALVVMGRLVSVARGEQDYFSPDGIPTAAEGCKSNALMRCCKDLGVASELWDPHWIRTFSKERVREVWVEHAVTKKRRKISLLKGRDPLPPFKETK